MSVQRAEILRLRLRCDITAPRLARKALEWVDAIRPVHDEALLVVSELTTNAVLHSGAGPAAEIELRAELAADSLVIEVSDEGHSETTPHIKPADASTPGGFGLPVVAAIARAWGTESNDVTRVWAELAL